MARFAYTARSSSGASLEGEIVAETEREAVSRLRSQGTFVVKLQPHLGAEDRDLGPVLVLGGRVKQEDVIFFFAQLSIMVETGVSLTEAIHCILTQTPEGRFRAVLRDVASRLESGESFSAALARHPKVFGDFYVNLLRAAEASGTMGPMLKRCADYLTARRELQKRIKSALTYPAVLLAAAVGVTAFLMTYVLPKFLAIYAGRKATLPVPTAILIAITNALVEYWMFLLGGTVCGIGFLMWFFRAERPRPWAHWVQLHVPLLGSMLRKSYIASGLRTLGLLVDSGVSMLDAVGITGSLSPNHYFRRLWSDVATNLHRGEQLSTPLQGSALMPRPVVQMIEAGEKSGKLGTVLVRLCDYLDEELRTTIKTITQLIEPIMIGVMGVMIGGIAIALLLPILTISKTISH